MKALIWILSFIAVTVFNVILGYSIGFNAGFLIVYILWCLIARTLCKKWDKFLMSKKVYKSGVTSFAYIKKEISSTILEKCEALRCNEKELKKYLNLCINTGKITKSQSYIIFDEYMTFRDTEALSPILQKVCDESDDIRFCRKCGEPLAENSKACQKCGTQIVETTDI